jgi:bifunctional non-homologous end joining protein LigD
MAQERPAVADAVVVELEALRAPRQHMPASGIKLMLAETAEKPFSDKAWVFELKYDGYRVLAAREQALPRLVYRKGSDATAIYPEIARALAALPSVDLVIDGEVVVLDEAGRPSFQRLQRRAQQRRAPDIQRSARELPATLCARCGSSTASACCRCCWLATGPCATSITSPSWARPSTTR